MVSSSDFGYPIGFFVSRDAFMSWNPSDINSIPVFNDVTR
jgi:hypothetical protein